MFTPEAILIYLAAYFIGSVPSAVWVGKLFYGIDVRDYGSKNAGATNTFRILGRKAGVPVLLADILKGWIAVSLVLIIKMPENKIDIQVMAGVAAVIGHIFPVYASFKGGKGIATLFGVIIALYYQIALLSAAIFLIMLLITKYVSLASVIAALVFPVFTLLNFSELPLSLVIFSAAIFVAVVITHISNIKRLIKGKETKTYLLKRIRKNHPKN